MLKKKESVGHFLPEKLLGLLKKEKIEYKGIQLKSAYIVNIISDMIMKYYYHKDDLLDNEIKFNLSSLILKSKYGMHYNHYMDYILEKEYLFMTSNYCNGGKHAKARTYKVNPKYLLNIKRCWTNDKVLIKKHSKTYLIESHKKYNKSPIPFDIRDKLVNDLYKVEMNIDKSLNFLEIQKKSHVLSHNKYIKNMMSVKNIADMQIFFTFDMFGRMHTNYTILKKKIRQKYVKIDGEDICEIDLENSQPLFFSYLMKLEMSKSDLIKKDSTRYIELVTNGLIYEEIMNKCGIKNRDDAKTMMYKVLFGNNGAKKYNKMFNSLFPTVFKFLTNYKKKLGSYKKVSHKLQNLESDFIFNKVIRQIYDEIPDIKLFTVHDSICFPCKYKEKVEYIFNLHKRKIIEY